MNGELLNHLEIRCLDLNYSLDDFLKSAINNFPPFKIMDKFNDGYIHRFNTVKYSYSNNILTIYLRDAILRYDLRIVFKDFIPSEYHLIYTDMINPPLGDYFHSYSIHADSVYLLRDKFMRTKSRKERIKLLKKVFLRHKDLHNNHVAITSTIQKGKVPFDKILNSILKIKASTQKLHDLQFDKFLNENAENLYKDCLQLLV